jgi:hypothetical protein
MTAYLQSGPSIVTAAAAAMNKAIVFCNGAFADSGATTDNLVSRPCSGHAPQTKRACDQVSHVRPGMNQMV